MKNLKLLVFLILLVMFIVTPAYATSFFFSTGNPDGKIGTTSGSANGIETESADDFVLTSPTSITNATFTGLLSGATTSNIQQVIVEIYRVFPLDSTNPPSGDVPTRLNSPSDVALDFRDSSSGGLTFGATDLGSFTVANSVIDGIHPIPNQTTQGEGPVTGDEFIFNVTFTTPFDLPADHYFFVPQVLLSSGDFLWLSAPKPIVPPGTPFPAGSTDLQSWIRNANLDPDWLRVGTDIVGPPPTGGPAPTFNAAFSLNGNTATVPEPSTILLLGVGLAGVGIMRRRFKR